MKDTVGSDLTPKKRVCIVGAGAAGMSAAYALSRDDKFEVVVFDERIATDLDTNVVLASPQWANVLALLDAVGFVAKPTKLQVAVGRDDTFWTNAFPTTFSRKVEKDVKWFSRLLSYISWCPLLWIFVPICIACRLFNFGDDFIERTLTPIMALFLPGGNMGMDTAAPIVMAAFRDPHFGWLTAGDMNSETLLAKTQEVLVLPKMNDVYAALREQCEAKGTTFHLSHTVTQVKERGRQGVLIQYRDVREDDNEPVDLWFDELIITIDAQSALHILGRTASTSEISVLSKIDYYEDMTVIHTDEEYMRRHYEFAPESVPDGVTYAPVFFARNYVASQDTEKVEVTYDVTRLRGDEGVTSGHTFQTTFFDLKTCQAWWSDKDISDAHRLSVRTSKQPAHAPSHYYFFAAWLWLLNGRQHTQFAGKWTLANTTEVEVVSGLAAASRLGAAYPFAVEGRRGVERYLRIAHWARMSRV